MEEEILLWIWLQCCLGTNNMHINRIFECFENIEKIYCADEKELRLSGAFSEKEIYKVTNKNLEKAKKIYNDCKKLGYKVLPLDDCEYPRMLKDISSPPSVIYVKGEMPDQNNFYVAVVGTRQSTNLGKKTAFNFSYELAKRNTVIVSGGALGIDMQAHIGALQAGGTTVCVLGCGINYNYLSSNLSLRNRIAKNGALISEYPPDYPPAKYTFPQRNRIISGMSHCTLVVEAGKNSGALITAKDAAKQNKTIFAVPGSVDNFSSQGSNILLKEGAKTALNYCDILNWYKSRENDENKNGHYGDTKDIKNIKIEKKRRSKSTNSETTQQEPQNDSYKERIRLILENYDNNFDDNFNGNFDEKTLDDNLKNSANQIKGTDSRVQKQKKPLNVTEYNKKKTPEKVGGERKNIKELKKDKKNSMERLTENASAVYDTISDEPVHVDDIKLKTGLTVSQLLTALTELELNGFIVSLSGRRYIRNADKG